MSFRLPNLKSYRGRYALLSLITISLLVIAAFVGRFYVENISSREISHVEERASAGGLITDALSQINDLEITFRRYVGDSAAGLERSIDLGLDLSKRSIERLHESTWVLRDELFRSVSLELARDQEQLAVKANELVRIRSELENWFPIIRILETRMLPHNEEVEALFDASRAEVLSEYSLRQRLEALVILSDLQDTWSGMIDELRLLVANRFGVFASQSEQAMQSRMENVALFSGQFARQLEQMEKMSQQGKLGFVAEQSVIDIRRHFDAWMDGYRDLSAMIVRDDWRVDLGMLRQDILPILNRMRMRLSSLDLELDTQSARGISVLSEVIDDMSYSMLWLALFGMLIIMISYLTMQRALLKPIETLTEALKMEARGAGNARLPVSNVQESRNLIEAFNEMSEQVSRRQRDLDHMLHHDSLTQLPNRLLYKELLRQAIRTAERDDLLVGVLLIDLDNFKQINDSLGHSLGDQVLVVISRRLQSIIEDTDTVARFSGDEFAILATNIRHRSELVSLANRIMEVFDTPVIIDEYELHTRASMGISVSPLDDKDADNLIRDADSAMYAAKREGRARFAFFSQDMTDRVTEYLHLEQQVRQAVENDEFRFYYQPIVGLGNQKYRHFEALMRWVRPDGEVLTPAKFMQVLDDSGLLSKALRKLMLEIGDFQRARLNRGRDMVVVSVNLSASQLVDNMFMEEVFDMMEAEQLLPKQMIIEITENTLVDDILAARHNLQRLRDAGVKIALDDYGTGQSSLSHLRGFVFDIVKIDRQFIRDITVDSADEVLVKAVIKLANAFGMKTVAEGVETEDQYNFVRRQGCDYVQGFLTGRPMPRDKIEQMGDGRGNIRELKSV